MKINVRLLLITFAIVVLVSVTSTFIFYSLTNKLLQTQQTKTLLNSSNDFIFLFQSTMNQVDEDLNKIDIWDKNFRSVNLDSTSIDFIFTLVNDSIINPDQFKARKNISYLEKPTSIKQFVFENPNMILKYSQLKSGKVVYYGKLITTEFLDMAAEKVRAEVALIVNDTPVGVSNHVSNQDYLPDIIDAIRVLNFKNNFDLYGKELEKADFLATYYTPKFFIAPGGKLNFVIFTASAEAVEFRATMRMVMFVIIFAGIALALIFILLFTTKLRKQISILSEAVEITGKGDLDHRVDIISKDEIGKLGEAFNGMLDELKNNKKAEKEYSEFITLINQNPTLTEVSDAALAKIINSTGLTFGVLYLINEKKLRLISSYAVSKNIVMPSQDIDFYRNAIEKKEKIEFIFKDNFPEIKTGLATIKIKYLLIVPVIYNKEVISIIELASESYPNIDVKKYLDNILEQLAVGLTNAKSFEQLENFVEELRRLNEEYQKQNKQISQKNEQLLELHTQLKEKADELEKQRAKAVELTKVKSQFLASMSHELRTPLISILGLTELMMKDYSGIPKTKERLAVVMRNGKKLLTLINNILEFSKFESGKIEIKKESFLLENLLEEIKSDITPIAAEKKLDFSVEVNVNQSILLNTDKVKLEQVLANLLMNAVKFTETGFVKLVVAVEDSSVNFDVIDSGIGISDENKKIVFHEFRQADASNSRKFGGAGLGLTICNKYAELLNGKISLESKPGSGSKFSFFLPDVVLERMADPGSTFLSPVETENKTQNGSVLLITSNDEADKIFKDYLRSYDFEVLVSQGFDEAVKIAKDILPKAIVIDLFVGNLDPWQFIMQLVSNPATSNTAFIITVIFPQSKIGYGLGPVWFVNSFIDKTGLTDLLNTMGLNAEKKPVDIVSLINKEKEASKVFDNTLAVNIHSPAQDENIETFVQNIQPDILLVDLDNKNHSVFKTLHQLKQNRLTRNVIPVVQLPFEISEKSGTEFTNELKEIAEKVKYHPLDILKVLRDSLLVKGPQSPEELVDNTKVEERIENISGIAKTGDVEKILIVDDDTDTLFTIGEILRENDYETIYAHNGVECLVMLKHLRPDLILLDIMMPQMDGFETIKNIRKDNQLNNIPVIALTAYAMLDNKEVIEKNGFNDLITKPISSSLLISTIRKYSAKKYAEQK